MPNRAYTGQPAPSQLVGGPNGDDISASNPLSTADQPYTGIRYVDISSTDYTVVQVGGKWPRGLDVGQGGTLKIDVIDPDGSTTNTITLAGVPDGYRLPASVIRKIYKTGTSAASMMLGW